MVWTGGPLRAACMWCKRPLVFTPGDGWVHTGGSLVVRRCPGCSRTFDTPLQAPDCPECGEQLRDDHAGLPQHG